MLTPTHQPPMQMPMQQTLPQTDRLQEFAATGQGERKHPQVLPTELRCPSEAWRAPLHGLKGYDCGGTEECELRA